MLQKLKVGVTMRAKQSKRKKEKSFKLFIFMSVFISLSLLSLTIWQILSNSFKLSDYTTFGVLTILNFLLILLISTDETAQCVFMLTIPKILSKKGRMFIVASAFLVVFSGPTKNLIANSEILAESLGCSQVIFFLKIARKFSNL